jgi:nitrite reductase/ring-hydroxylating ferredoxin subunit
LAITLCYIDEIGDPGSKGFQIKSGEQTTNIFVVHKNGAFHGYLNSCPHTGATLDWQEDKFLDMDNAFIQCSTHDALFDIKTGRCFAGPCVGDHLTAIDIFIDTKVKNGALMVDL